MTESLRFKMSLSRLVSKALDAYREEGPIGFLGRLARSAEARLKDELVLECQGVEAVFDTSTPPSRKWFFPRYMDGNLHEPVLTRRLLSVLEPDSVVYDLGANVGYFTVFAAKACPEGLVHAFEIDETLLEATRQSLEKTGVSASLVGKAVSATSGDTVAYDPSTVPVVSDDGEGAFEVQTVCLDDYADEREPPDVVKVDVEGYEHQVLEGMRDLLDRAVPDTVFLEVHPEQSKAYGPGPNGILALLDEHGYGYAPVTSEGKRRMEGLPTELEGTIVLECRPAEA